MLNKVSVSAVLHCDGKGKRTWLKEMKKSEHIIHSLKL